MKKVKKKVRISNKPVILKLTKIRDLYNGDSTCFSYNIGNGEEIVIFDDLITKYKDCCDILLRRESDNTVYITYVDDLDKYLIDVLNDSNWTRYCNEL